MPKKFIFPLVALLLLVGASVSDASMYMDTKLSGVSSLFTLTTGSVAQKVGDIYNGTLTPDINDIAYDASNQTMYAITGNRLWSLNYLNPSGGIVTATPVGGTHTTGRQGLEVIGGTIYTGTAKSTAASGSLYTLDPGTGAATLKGSFGTWGGDYIGEEGDLAYGNGKLYATMNWAGTGHAGTYLATIDPSTGAATEIARTGYYTGSTFHAVNLDGIVFDDGILYGTTRGSVITPAELFIINDANALVTKVDTTTGFYSSYGLTQVPLPPTALLLGSGLLGLGLLRFRNKA